MNLLRFVDKVNTEIYFQCDSIYFFVVKVFVNNTRVRTDGHNIIIGVRFDCNLLNFAYLTKHFQVYDYF